MQPHYFCYLKLVCLYETSNSVILDIFRKDSGMRQRGQSTCLLDGTLLEHEAFLRELDSTSNRV